MDAIKNLFNQMPEISAAIITALFGILGIIINVLINYSFRKKDYKLKNFAHDLEIIEKFYIPFQRLLGNLITLISNFQSNDNLYDIIKKKGDSQNDSNRVLLSNLVSEIDKLLCENNYNYIGDYSLYNCQQEVIKIIYIIKDSSFEDDKVLKEMTKVDINKKLSLLVNKIEDRKIRLLSKNYLVYLYRKLQKKRNK